jgi:DNA-binding beta-propeller fold protein YncE
LTIKTSKVIIKQIITPTNKIKVLLMVIPVALFALGMCSVVFNAKAATLSNGQQISGSYMFIKSLGFQGIQGGQFNGPNSIAIDRSGNIYVLDSGNSRIQQFNDGDNFIKKWGEMGSGKSQFRGPTGIAVDPTGNVYVLDSGNHRIQKFDSTNNFTFITS